MPLKIVPFSAITIAAVFLAAPPAIAGPNSPSTPPSPQFDPHLLSQRLLDELIAATAVARLAQEGRIDIDAPVTRIVPSTNNAWNAITARQLAAHTSGLPHYQDVDDDLGSRHYPDGPSAVAIFADRALLALPGQRYSYSSWGYTLLGALVEARTAQPFTDYVAQHITPGLDIKRDMADSDNLTGARPYEFINRVPRRAAPNDFSYTWGGGGLSATAPDLARFGGRMLRDQIVTAETFDWMVHPARLNDGTPVVERDYSVGFGWRTSLDQDGAAIAHHAGTTVGARSVLVLWRDASMVVSLLSNAQWVSRIEQTAIMLAAPFRTQPLTLMPAACPLTSRRYNGTFGADSVSGTVSFAMDNGLCTGTMAIEGAFSAYFDAGMQRRADTLRIIGIDPTAGLSRSALVTPFGLSDLRHVADGQFSAAVTSSRMLTIRFMPD